MSLTYSLTENLLTANANEFKAQPVNVRSYTMSEIIQRILARNPGLSQAQITAAIDEFFKESSMIIEDGGALNTPLMNTQPSIAGVFHGATDVFDPKRHRVKTNVFPGKMLQKATAGIKTQKAQTADPMPFILEVHDVLSDTFNEQLTPGGVIQIWGGRLRLATENPENGIFLTDDLAQTIKLTTIIENKPARIIAMLPQDLPAGTYTLELRTSFVNSGKESKSMKTGRFNRELTAVSN